MNQWLSFLWGAISMGFGVGAMLFYRFYVRTRETIFSYFAVAFVLFAIERVLLLSLGTSQEAIPIAYLVRLLGFIVILAGIVAQNTGSGDKNSPNQPS